MVQEGFPFLGSIADVMADPSKFDPWSRRNMRLSNDPQWPAPRTQGDPIAMKAAYTSGMVFRGQAPLPTIDHRRCMMSANSTCTTCASRSAVRKHA